MFSTKICLKKNLQKIETKNSEARLKKKLGGGFSTPVQKKY
jgi:hypothetical protein